MNADVEKAVERLHEIAYRDEAKAVTVRTDDLRSTLQALRDQEAEIDRLRTSENLSDLQYNRMLAKYEGAESRATLAEALLRNVVHQWPSLSCEAFHHRKTDQHSSEEECRPLQRWRALYSRITTHLGANHD